MQIVIPGFILFLGYVFGPLFWFGVATKNVTLVKLALCGGVSVLILSMGFGLGLAFSWAAYDISYLKLYVIPDLWSTAMLKRDAAGPWLLRAAFAPHVMIIDGFRVYVHFNFTNPSIALAIPEIVSIKVLVDAWHGDGWFTDFRKYYHPGYRL